MKKLISLTIAFLMVLCLTACNGKNANSDTSSDETGDEEAIAEQASSPISDLGPDANPTLFTISQLSDLPEISDEGLALYQEHGQMDTEYTNKWIKVSGISIWDGDDSTYYIKSSSMIGYYFYDETQYNKCFDPPMNTITVIGYCSESGDFFRLDNCIFVEGVEFNIEEGTSSIGGEQLVGIDSQYFPPQYEGNGKPKYLSSADLDPHSITEEELQKYIAHITPGELNDLNGQSDYFIDNSWVLIYNLQANLYYSYSSNYFHDFYQTTYTFLDGEDIYLFTDQGRAGAVLGYVTYDRGYYQVDDCIVYEISSGTTSDDDTYEFTAEEFSKIQVDDSVVSKYQNITLRITGVEVQNINVEEGSFRSNVRNRLVLLLDPREITNLTNGDVVTIECKIGFAMVRGYVFYDAVIVS